jgi:sugar-specific transcriptional regulator TrmB
MLEQILKRLELDNEAVKTYLHLLEVGPTTASQLAKQLNIPRPSIYGFINRLEEKGLITESKNLADVKVFTAEPPEKIKFLFEQKIEDLKKQENLYEQLLPELIDRKLPYSVPNFQLFKGKEGVKHALKDALLYSNLQTYSYWPISDIIEVVSDEFLWWLNKERIKNNLAIKTIWPRSKAIDLNTHPYMGVGEEMKREIRIAPKNVDFSMGYWIYGRKVMFISSKGEGFGCIIESPELVEMLLSQYMVLWEMSKPVTMKEGALEPFLEELNEPII